jgi:hypothetical protein
VDCQCICLHKVSLSNTLLALKGRCIDSPFFFFSIHSLWHASLRSFFSRALRARSFFFRARSFFSRALRARSFFFRARSCFSRARSFVSGARMPSFHISFSFSSFSSLSAPSSRFLRSFNWWIVGYATQLMLIDVGLPSNPHFVVLNVRILFSSFVDVRIFHFVVVDAPLFFPFLVEVSLTLLASPHAPSGSSSLQLFPDNVE